MKKTLVSLLITVFLLTLGCVVLSSCARNGGEGVTLYVYNWGEYISDGSEDTLDVNAEFERYCREVLGKNVEIWQMYLYLGACVLVILGIYVALNIFKNKEKYKA